MILRVFDGRELEANQLPAEHPFVIAMTHPMSAKTEAELKAIDDNIAAAWRAAKHIYVGGPKPL